MNFERFYDNLNYFAKIGQEKDASISRLAFSKEYFQAIEEMETYAKNLGLDTRIDKIGNLFFSYNPNGSDKFLMVGSHMDTVKNGGMYDGALGAVAALEVVESLCEEEIDTDYGVIGAAFNAEEGSNLGGTFGSRTITNRSNYEDPLLEDKLNSYNLSIEDLRDSLIDFSKIIGFLELHIEQGAYLDREGLDIGIVDGIVGVSRYIIRIKGEANHGGTTPMDLRNDPVRQVPLVIEKLYELANVYDDPFVMTIGNISLSPGMYNVIPEEVEIYVEIRDKKQENLDKYIEDLTNFLEDNFNNCQIEEVIQKAPVYLDKKLMNIIEETCDSLDYKYRLMTSGADHDAKEISHLVPAGLIFVPSIGGISHSKREYTRPDQIEKGLNLLYESILSVLKK